MDLSRVISRPNLILAVAERVNKKYPNATGKCEVMAKDLVAELKRHKIPAKHVVGIFKLDEPDAERYMQCDFWEGQDEYEVNHDWVEIEGKILDVSARQFRKSVYIKIPDIVFINYKDPLFLKYKMINYYGGN